MIALTMAEAAKYEFLTQPGRMKVPLNMDEAAFTKQELMADGRVLMLALAVERERILDFWRHE